MVLRIICILLTIYWIVLFARILLSWFPPPRSDVGRRLFEFVYDVTEPVLRPVRGLLPTVRMGAMGFDFSPILVFIALAVIRGAIGCGFAL